VAVFVADAFKSKEPVVPLDTAPVAVFKVACSVIAPVLEFFVITLCPFSDLTGPLNVELLIFIS
jgi:hypothetical protein